MGSIQQTTALCLNIAHATMSTIEEQIAFDFIAHLKNTERKDREQQERGMTQSYLVNCRSLASMLRCLIHILVRAEPISLVAPGKKTQPGSDTHTLINTHCSFPTRYFLFHGSDFMKAVSALCEASKNVETFKQTRNYTSFVFVCSQPVFTQESDLPLGGTKVAPK